MIESLHILLLALFLPLGLIPIEKMFPYPHVIEELAKALLVLAIYQKEKQLDKKLFNLVLLSGLLFTISESIFYLINILNLGDLSMIPKRLLFTGILHCGTIVTMYLLGRKNNINFAVAVFLSIIAHYLYNLWAGNFF